MGNSRASPRASENKDAWMKTNEPLSRGFTKMSLFFSPSRASPAHGLHLIALWIRSPRVRATSKKTDKVDFERFHQFIVDRCGGILAIVFCAVGKNPRLSQPRQASGHGSRIFLELTGWKSLLFFPTHGEWRRQGVRYAELVHVCIRRLVSTDSKSRRFRRYRSKQALVYVNLPKVLQSQ